MFKNRQAAGEKLALGLRKYQGEKPVVLGIPRGGVETAYYVARELKAPLSIIITRKLPMPGNEELGFGAVAEDGSQVVLDYGYQWLRPEEIERIIGEQKEEISRRIEILRGGEDLPEIKDKTVIIVDDGMAMGVTMKVAVKMCQNKKAAKVIVAVPVSSKEAVADIGKMVDEVVVLEIPEWFQAVGQFYEDFPQLTDEEVREMIF